MDTDGSGLRDLQLNYQKVHHSHWLNEQIKKFRHMVGFGLRLLRLRGRVTNVKKINLEGPVTRAPFPGTGLVSCQCTCAQLQSSPFQSWAIQIHENPTRLHRKIWEWCYISEALYEHGMLAPGRRGLGFAVGQEPLSALFASLGSDIVATDLSTKVAEKSGSNWVETNQHANSLKAINQRAICGDEVFNKRASFRFLDMRELPDDLGKFDFIWSASSFEHLGTMALSEAFIYESLKYLKPGGIAVHTTEYNLSSNNTTLKAGTTVLFRRKDIERIALRVRSMGYRIILDFSRGDSDSDRFVDIPPYPNQDKIHLRLDVGGYVVTSFGLIIEKVST